MKIYLGQQAIIEGGGTVQGFVGVVARYRDDFPFQSIGVKHPITGVVKDYAPDNVTLVPIATPQSPAQGDGSESK